MKNGYVCLWRKSIDSMVFANPELWKLWCLCLMKAKYKTGFVDMDGIVEPIKLLPGQFITGRYSLHRDYYPKNKKTNKSPKTVWRWLEILKKCGNLTIKSYNKYSIITVCNWESYQNNVQQMSNRCPTDVQQMTTYNKDNNVNNNKKIYASVINYLNEKADKNFNPKTKETKQHINARLRDGFKEEDFKKVIDIKCAKWKSDPKMYEYLRPKTLFGNKFESYLQDKPDIKPKNLYELSFNGA